LFYNSSTNAKFIVYTSMHHTDEVHFPVLPNWYSNILSRSLILEQFCILTLALWQFRNVLKTHLFSKSVALFWLVF